MKLIQWISKKAFFYRHTLMPALFFLFTSNAMAQDKAPVNFGKIKDADFTVSSTLINANTNAVVLFDKGDVSFEGNRQGWFSYVFKHRKRIKIINRKGFDLATVEIFLYQIDNSKETVEKLAAVTYNYQNGTVSETTLNAKDIFEEKTDKNHLSKKFTMPAVSEGSIIDYSYTIKSDFEFNLPAWEFQRTHCPTLWSEYNVNIPGLLNYMTFFQGYHRYFIDKSSEGFKNYSISRERNIGGHASTENEIFSVSSPTTMHRWVMIDLPVFYVENYISSPVNFIDKISFQLSNTYDGENYHDVLSNWKKVTQQLMKREDFGQYLLKGNGWLDKLLRDVVSETDGTLEAAKKIYYHVQNNYTCTDQHSKFIKTSLQDVVKKKSGTVGDINLLLIAMLSRRNLPVSPVVLSTRAVGRNPKDYPLMEKLDYVIGKVNINSRNYFLDATTPFLPFGKLPSKCYNGHARVIAEDTTAISFEADSIKESRMVNVVIINNENAVEGSYTNNMGFFESMNTKNTVAESGLNRYKTTLQQSFPGEFQISNMEVDSIQSIESPVTVHFDFNLSSFQHGDIIYFNPVIGEASAKNPFTATERIYPVEMPYTIDDTYTLNMEIPTGYKVEELPKSARIKLNEDEGMFEYLVKADDKMIQMRCRIMLKKANFVSEDYQTLRDFYGYVVSKEAEQIVFKKIK